MNWNGVTLNNKKVTLLMNFSVFKTPQTADEISKASDIQKYKKHGASSECMEYHHAYTQDAFPAWFHCLKPLSLRTN